MQSPDKILFLPWGLHRHGKWDVVDRNTQAYLDRQDIPDRGEVSLVIKKPVVFFNIHA